MAKAYAEDEGLTLEKDIGVGAINCGRCCGSAEGQCAITGAVAEALPKWGVSHLSEADAFRQNDYTRRESAKPQNHLTVWWASNWGRRPLYNSRVSVRRHTHCSHAITCARGYVCAYKHNMHHHGLKAMHVRACVYNRPVLSLPAFAH